MIHPDSAPLVATSAGVFGSMLLAGLFGFALGLAVGAVARGRPNRTVDLAEFERAADDESYAPLRREQPGELPSAAKGWLL
jgi:ABC-type transporter Mla subunit MlaD